MVRSIWPRLLCHIAQLLPLMHRALVYSTKRWRLLCSVFCRCPHVCIPHDISLRCIIHVYTTLLRKQKRSTQCYACAPSFPSVIGKPHLRR